MKKIDQVYREILYQEIENRKGKLTQSELALNLGFSLSTINLAVKKLEKIGAVIIESRGFRVIDIMKILIYSASIRNLDKDVIYITNVNLDVREIERNIPDVYYACFSAYKFKFKDSPFDYSEVFVYAFEDQLKEIKKRFPEKNEFKRLPNLYVLKADENMRKYGKTLTTGQIFIDLWNLKIWYARYFFDEIEKKLNKLFGMEK